eukprot:GGOE01057590.1.p1 GENE.GGOE01057590.1~~GGOE01057590.1.p1  ORF type:complete len:120 (+),score=8.04 GGOE01057590.1:348-707(+)
MFGAAEGTGQGPLDEFAPNLVVRDPPQSHAHSGMLQCRRGGFSMRLVSRRARSSQRRKRVVSGAMTESMKPRLAASVGVQKWSLYFWVSSAIFSGDWPRNRILQAPAAPITAISAVGQA